MYEVASTGLGIPIEMLVGHSLSSLHQERGGYMHCQRKLQHEVVDTSHLCLTGAALRHAVSHRAAAEPRRPARRERGVFAFPSGEEEEEESGRWTYTTSRPAVTTSLRRCGVCCGSAIPPPPPPTAANPRGPGRHGPPPAHRHLPTGRASLRRAFPPPAALDGVPGSTSQPPGGGSPAPQLRAALPVRYLCRP